MIKFHPNDQLIEQFVAGELAPALSVVVGTHVDMCQHCQKQVQDAEAMLAERLLKSPVKGSAPVLDQMLEQIFSSTAPTQLRVAANDDILTLEGKRFKLPPTLARQKSKIGHWSWVPGKMMRAPVDLGTDECINLIYMDQGSRVPEHTHRGQETTLVVNGVFNDEQNEYKDGDFIMLSGEHHHSPQTQDEDCLTLATLDAPLQFTSGISRLLNPFSSLFFR
ncbi:MAG: anti-ECFsigma factor ChrR [Idiomarinaceae bacterium HL-53]|nr:MAG: anti-ECFsigma factor ChrR [Idiomarinaceae bacterium HL-53]CUS48892.1 anti-ECFsigma factor, ChrR [Idiomarinaceae bacterium HL-53]